MLGLLSERKIISFNIYRLWAIFISRICHLITRSTYHYGLLKKKMKNKKNASHLLISVSLLMVCHLHEIPPFILADWIPLFLQVPVLSSSWTFILLHFIYPSSSVWNIFTSKPCPNVYPPCMCQRLSCT